MPIPFFSAQGTNNRIKFLISINEIKLLRYSIFSLIKIGIDLPHIGKEKTQPEVTLLE